MTIWLIGMSASGKTTIGEKLYSRLQNSEEKWVFIDGDTFRNILDEDLGHTIEDRRKNAYRISRFCEFLNKQGINILACVLSIFHDNQKYNRENIANYKEVFIDVKFENLLLRDNKKLYQKALNGEINNVVGVDIEFKPPYAYDMKIDNNINNPNYEEIVDSIINKFQINIDNKYIYTSKNLLENPHKYQYTKYEGNKFFKKFSNDRELSLSFLKKRFKKLNTNSSNYVQTTKKNFIKNNDIILKNFLLYLNKNDISELQKYKKNIELLIKRFEVSKKLYFTYDKKEIRKSSVVFDDLSNYPLFSLVLQKYYHLAINQEKLVYLNAILKLNDLISSIKSDFILYEEVDYSIKALNGEIQIIKEYL